MTESKSSPLEITMEQGDASTTVTVAGEIDLESSAALHDALEGLRDGREVHLDLSNVDYMDSTGLRAVLIAKEEIESAGGSLDVVAASSIVSRLIEITGIDGLLAG